MDGRCDVSFGDRAFFSISDAVALLSEKLMEDLSML
jgi:hypothetical protein